MLLLKQHACHINGGFPKRSRGLGVRSYKGSSLPVAASARLHSEVLRKRFGPEVADCRGLTRIRMGPFLNRFYPRLTFCLRPSDCEDRIRFTTNGTDCTDGGMDWGSGGNLGLRKSGKRVESNREELETGRPRPVEHDQDNGPRSGRLQRKEQEKSRGLDVRSYGRAPRFISSWPRAPGYARKLFAAASQARGRITLGTDKARLAKPSELPPGCLGLHFANSDGS